ncbi:hypothetical protein OAB00_02925 [Akkermansiaceae bacterium]|nr:hypothetical protein [Akkermansiaceae bacterium]
MGASSSQISAQVLPSVTDTTSESPNDVANEQAQSEAESDAELNVLLEDQLFSERDPIAFERLYQKVKNSDDNPQILFEARFLYYIDLGNNDKISSLLELYDFDEISKNFNAFNSKVFGSKDDFDAVVCYIKAVKYFEEDNIELFKENIKEAFWLSPEQAPVYQTLIEKSKLQNVIADYTFPAFHKFQLQVTNKDIPGWRSIIPDQKGLLIYFYNPWNYDCFQLAPEVKNVNQVCIDNNFAHIQHRVEQSEDADIENGEYMLEVGPANANAWTVETYRLSTIDVFRLKTMPTLVLLNKEGKILFHGNITEFMERYSNKAVKTE